MEKVTSNKDRLAYQSAVEEALCFGWIDSRANKIDERTYVQLFSPRRPKGGWSQINKRRVGELIAAGRMRPARFAMVELAKKSGTWTVLDQSEDLIEPADLKKALRTSKMARSNWDAFPPSARKSILHWIAAAKKADTRAKRIDETVRRAADNIRANQ